MRLPFWCLRQCLGSGSPQFKGSLCDLSKLVPLQVAAVCELLPPTVLHSAHHQLREPGRVRQWPPDATHAVAAPRGQHHPSYCWHTLQQTICQRWTAHLATMLSHQTAKGNVHPAQESVIGMIPCMAPSPHVCGPGSRQACRPDRSGHSMIAQDMMQNQTSPF